MKLRRGRKKDSIPDAPTDSEEFGGSVRIIRPAAPTRPVAVESEAPSEAARSLPDNGFRDASTASVSVVPSSTTEMSATAPIAAESDGSSDEPVDPDQLSSRPDRSKPDKSKPGKSKPGKSKSGRSRFGRSKASKADSEPDASDDERDGPAAPGGDGATDDDADRLPGGDPLLARASGIGTDPTASSSPLEPDSLGRSGVRVIPAKTAGEGTSVLDPTAPFDGPGGVDEAGPDDVTVRGRLDTGGDASGRPTIVINDDGASAVGAESGVSSRIDPKFRARRRAIRRSMGRKRMAFLGLGVIIIVIGVVVGALLGSPLFALRSSQVEITGWRYADEGEMYAIFDDLAGTPVLRIDEEAVEDRLEAVPWVEQAVVDTRLPNSATIQIRERVPLATYQGADGRFRVLDRAGRVLEIVDGMPVEYMWITVSDPPNLEPGEFAATGIAAAAEMTRSLTPTIRPRVRRIAVDQSGSSMAVYLRDGTRVNFGAARDIFAKLVRLETLLTDFPGMADVRIDVSTAETTRSSASLLELTDGAKDPPVEAPADAGGDETTDAGGDEANDAAAATDAGGDEEAEASNTSDDPSEDTDSGPAGDAPGDGAEDPATPTDETQSEGTTNDGN